MLKIILPVILCILHKCIAMYLCNIVYSTGQTGVQRRSSGSWLRIISSHHVTVVPDLQYMFLCLFVCLFVPVLLSTARRSWREVHLCRLLRSEAIQIKKRCGIYHAGVLFVCLFIYLVCQCLLMWVNIKPSLSLQFFSSSPSLYPPFLLHSFPSFSFSSPTLPLTGHSHNPGQTLQWHP